MTIQQHIFIPRFFLLAVILLCGYFATAQCVHEPSQDGCPVVLYVGNDTTPGPMIPSEIYEAQTTVTSDGTVAAPDSVIFRGNEILMNAGFEVEPGAEFHAYIDPCTSVLDRVGNAYYVNDDVLAGDIYTTATGSDLTGSGSPDEPYATLKYVIENVELAPGDTVYVDAGTYHDAFIEIDNPVIELVIKGAGFSETVFDNNGTETANLFMRILSDDILLEGFTVQNYNFEGLQDGKAVSISGAVCTFLRDVFIINNIAPSGNAALLINGGAAVNLSGISCSFNGGSTTLQGGGIDIVGNGNIVGMENSIVCSNEKSRASNGGGIFVAGDSTTVVTIDSSAISNNSAGYGGGIYVSNGAILNLNNSCVSTNTVDASSGAAYGGGICVGRGSSVELYNTFFDGNKAGFVTDNGKGGAIGVDANLGLSTDVTYMWINNCLFSNNTVTSGGVDVYVSASNDAPVIVEVYETAFFAGNNAIQNENVATVNIQNSGMPNTTGSINFVNTTSAEVPTTSSCPAIPGGCEVCTNLDPTGDGFQIFCGTDSLTVSDLVASGNLITWYDTPAGGTTYDGNELLSDGTIYYAADENGGCNSIGRLAVTVMLNNDELAVDAGEDQSICVDGSVMLNATDDPNLEYSWTPTTGLDNPNIANPVASPSVTTNYFLSVNLMGCTSTVSDVMTVTVTENIMADAGPDRAICPGLNVGLGTGDNTDYTYSWTPTAGLNNPNIANPTASPTATTTYTLSVSSPNCTNTDTDQVTVTVSIQAQADAGPDQVICLGEGIEIGSDPQPGYSYSWSPVDGLSNPNIANPIASPTENTTYSLLLTSPNCLLSDVDKVDIIIDDTATANAGIDQSICPGESVTIGTEAVDGYTYSWTPVLGLSNPNIANPVASPGITTTYTLITNSPFCANDGTDMVVVTVNETDVANAGEDQTICLGESINIGTASEPGLVYMWSPATGLDDHTAANPVASPLETTVYTVSVSVPGCAVISTDELVIFVSELTTADAGTDQTICPGSGVTIGSEPRPGYVYTWSPTTGLNNPNIANPVAAPGTTTTYTLVANSPNCSESGTDQVLVTVSDTPVASAGEDQTICAGLSVQIGATSLPGYTYSWTPTEGLSDPTIANPVASPTITTKYTLIVTAPNCSNTGTDEVTVTVSDSPIASAGEDKTICLGLGVQIGGTGQPGYVYTWSPVTGLNNANIPNPTASPTATTLYTLTVSSPYCDNSTTDEVLVFVGDVALADAGLDQIICPGEGVEIGVASQPGYSYSWTPTEGLSNPNIANPVASPAVATTYTLTTSSDNCSNSGTDQVWVGYTNEVITFPETQIICYGNEVRLTAYGGIAYNWTPATGLSCTTCPNPLANPETTTTYTLVATDVNGCQRTETVTVFINPELGLSTINDATVCIGETVNLQATGADSYQWTPTTGLSCSICPNPTVQATGNVSYTVTGFREGCVETNQVNITIKPEITIEYTQTDCDITFTPSILNLAQYDWEMGDGTTYTMETVMHQYEDKNDGTYEVCLTVIGNCGERVCRFVNIDGCCADVPPPTTVEN